MKKVYFLFLLSLGLVSQLPAQNISEELVKYYTPNSWWATLRYEHFLKSGSYFYLENNNRFNLEPAFGASFPFNKIYRTSVWAGYEHKAHEKWYLGLSQKYVAIPFRDLWYSRINVTHRGKLSKLAFIKEVSLDHIRHPKSDNPFVISQNEGRVSITPTLIKTFTLQERPLYILLSYRASILFDWNNDGFSSYDTRNIDQSRLRFEISHFLGKSLLLSLYAIRDTRYYYQLAQFDQFGNETKPEAKVNQVTPTIGIGLTYVFRKPEEGYLPSFPGK